MNMFARARAIVTMPRESWPLIATEPDSGQRLFSGYVVPLAAIGPVCMLISLAGFRHHPVLGIVASLAGFASSLVFVWAQSLITARLSPRFAGTADRVQALKLIAYSSTAGWLAGVFYLIPFTGLLVLIARLYGLYLLRLGMEPVLGVRRDRATDAFLVIFLSSLAVGIILALLEILAAAPFAFAGILHALFSRGTTQ